VTLAADPSRLIVDLGALYQPAQPERLLESRMKAQHHSMLADAAAEQR